MSDPVTARRPSFRPRARRGILDLKIWERFHVKLTLFYCVVVLAALGLLSTAVYVGGVKVAMDGMRSRLMTTTVALSRDLAKENFEPLRAKSDNATPTYRSIRDDFAAVAGVQKDLLSVYLLRPTDEVGMFTFVADYIAPGKRTSAPADVGQSYDARSNALLQRGLQEPIVETEIARDEWGESLSAYAPVRNAAGKTIALVGVDLDAAAIRDMKTRIFGLAVLFSLIAAAVLGIAGLVVGRRLQALLVRVIDAATQIAAGDFAARVKLVRQDEFGILGEHFDDMAAGLEERDLIRATFGRYVSEDVAKRVLSGKDGAKMGGEVREVTVLFSDLRGYSTISETLSPTETVEFLNEYLEVMNAKIDDAGGCVIEFLGDAILAVFGAPSELEGHPEKAVRCAMAMRDGLAVFNERMNAEGRAPWLKKGMTGLGQRIGIHTGQVVAGNLGSKVRVKYAVIGDAVNVASRCEGLNKVLSTEILCTSSTYERLPDDLKAQLKDMGAHEVKGRANKVAVFAA